LSSVSPNCRLDATYIKAYYRRGSANYALGIGNLAKLKDARRDFKMVLKIRPNEADARKKYTECDNKIKLLAFSAAIENEEDDTPKLDIDTILVNSDYTGPRMVEGEMIGESGCRQLDRQKSMTVDFVKELIATFRDQKLLHRKYMMQLLVWAVDMFKEMPTLMEIPLPLNEDGSKGHFTVCGDTHGQYYDLLHIFEIGGFPSPTNPYLFNGDFVDRGSFSLEVVTTLIALKLAMPTAIYMSRGNHETKNMNKIYGFEGEVKHKYDDRVMNLFNDVFQWLPLAAVIENAVFVVHGGLSTSMGGGGGGMMSGPPVTGDGMTLDAIRQITRGREPPESGLMSDLLWSDPQPFDGRSASKRGVGYAFGPDYTKQFLALNNLQLVVRSHEVKEEGYVVEHDGKCITVFSAPNYCDSQGNKGAFIRFEEDMKPNFTSFTCVPHPNIPPMRYAGNMFGL
jgi:serine/threonine-protein phosphatase 5